MLRQNLETLTHARSVAGCERDRSLVYMCIIRLFRLFSRHISGTQSFEEYRHFNFRVGVVLKPLVSLMGRLVMCSSRIRVDRQKDRWTERTTTVTLAAHACAEG